MKTGITLLFVLTSFFTLAQNSHKLWEKVIQLEKEGNYISANKVVDIIYNKASAKGNEIQIIKTFFYNSKYAHKISPDMNQELVNKVILRIEKANLSSRAILYSIYARCLSEYYNKYEDVIAIRNVDNELKNDLTTWAATTIQKELSSALNFSKNNKDYLVKIPLESYKELFWYLNEEQIINKSLYVQLLKENLKIYQQRLPRNYYEASRVDNLFEATEHFLGFQVSPKHPDEFKDIVQIYKEIEEINPSEINQYERILYFGSTLFNLKNDFIPFLNKFQKGITSDKVIQNVLAVKSEIYQKAPSNTEQYFGRKIGIPDYIRQSSNTEEHYLKANLVIDSILKGPKNTNAYYNALRDKRTIGEKELKLIMPKTLYAKEKARIWVKYKNIEGIKVKCYRVNLNDFWALRTEYANTNKYVDSIIKNKLASHEFEVKLPRYNDGFSHSTEFLLPELSIGSYVFLFEAPDYGNRKVELNRTLAVSNINASVIIDTNTNKFRFLHRKTGMPIPNVKFYWDKEKEIETDSKGTITIIDSIPRDSPIIAITKNDTLKFIYNKVSFYQNYDSTVKGDGKFDYDEKLQWFFDRSIYRPGQTVHFKAIAFRSDENGKVPVANTSFEVLFSSYETGLIKEGTFTTNEYGSFSGSFDISKNGSTGRYHFQVKKPKNYLNDSCVNKESKEHPFWDNISIYQFEEGFINVEEYKRPVFEVQLDSNKKDYQRNDLVNVTGKAMLFSGNPLAHAKVKSTIYVNDYTSKNAKGEGTLISEGEVTSTKEGKFNIQFKAKPIGEESKPKGFVYRYSVNVAVIASTGERQEAKMFIKVGDTSSTFYVSVPKKISTDDLSQIKIFSDQFSKNHKNKVKVEFHLLELFNKKIKPRFYYKPSIEGISQEKFEELFPYEKYKRFDFDKKKRIKIAKEFEIDVEGTVEVSNKLYKNLPSGEYEIVFTQVDSTTGKKNERSELTTLIQSDDPYDLTTLITMEQLNDDPKKDGFVKLKLKSFEPKVHVRIIATNQIKKIYEKKFTIKDHEITIKIPLVGFNLFQLKVQSSALFENKMFFKDLSIRKRNILSKIDISTKHLKNKIKPGDWEEWSFKVNAIKTSSEIEVLASMYDRSLDQLKKSQWNQFSLYDFSEYFNSHYNDHESNGYKGRNHEMQGYFSYNPEVFFTKRREQVELMWYGFSMFDFKNISKDRKYLEDIRFNDKKEKILIRGIVMHLSEEGRWATKKLGDILVEVKGTNRMTITNKNGYYELEAEYGETLVFSYPGYEKVETVINKDQIDLNLQIAESSFFDYYKYQKNIHEENRNNQPISVGTDLFKNLSNNTKQTPIDEINRKEKSSTKAPLYEIQPRTNFDETAFFYPHLIPDDNGEFNFSFNAPESLTSWKLRLLAHNKELVQGYFNHEVVTQKELMIVPNMPRFFREKDTIVIKASVTNLTNKKVKGEAILEFVNPESNKSINMLMGNISSLKKIVIDPFDQITLNWNICVPVGLPRVEYKILAQTQNHSDGEQNQIPVLTNNQLITESIPIWMPPNSKKEFELVNLKSNASKTLQQHQLSLEYATNPTWYAIKALPYLIEYEHECAEQTFARYYANTLAEIIIESNPKIKFLIESWNNTEKLEKSEMNETLKSLLLAETPWFKDLKSREEQNEMIALLFDLKELKIKRLKTLDKLKTKQNKTGGFSWFEGGQDNEYITRHILAGLGHLNVLNSSLITLNHNEIVDKGLKYLDKTFLNLYENRLENKGMEYWYRPYSTEHYLYTRSFYINSHPVSDKIKEVISVYLTNIKSTWNNYSVYQKAMLAILFERFDMHSEAKKIINQLKESAVITKESGMYWKENINGWFWYQAPIETQSLLIEAFSEVGGESKAIDAMKVWLIKNKLTKNWPTTKSTTEAIYALMLKGNDWLDISDKTIFTIGKNKLLSKKLDENQKEANTGYVHLNWVKDQVTSDMGDIKIENRSKVPGVGAVYWQYFEQLENIKNQKTEGWSLKKSIVKKTNDKFIEIDDKTQLEIGDVLTIKLVLDINQNIEFVHLKDMRASCLEPVKDVVSERIYKKGGSYYKSTRDAATHFFFNKINKGSYLIQYDVKVNNAGVFTRGVSTLQSMYAPQYSCHSKGGKIIVRNN